MRPEELMAKIPEGLLRTGLLQLSREVRKRTLEKLSELQVPKEDYVSLRVSPDGSLYYVCDLQPQAALPSASLEQTEEAGQSANIVIFAAAPVPISSPPVRHSRPGATKVLYLDFNGHTITGTNWNGSVSTYEAVPYDTDGNPTTFSDTEQSVIIQVWERVAEDYATFDVDVTTEEPVTFTNTTGRALVTNSTDANGALMPSNTAGGVAYLSVFGSSTYVSRYSPAFVYYNHLGGGTSASLIAEAVSHELGHNLGLSHDAKTDGTSYYNGHGSGETSWGPIMGTGYNRNISQWSKGEYYLANNTQDDLAIIGSYLAYRPDDVGNTTAAATALAVTSGSFSTSGVLNSSTDVDVFSVSLTAGTVSLSAVGYRANSGTDGGNTDIKLELLNNAGAVLASSDPASSTKASFPYAVTAGTYYIRLSPVGTGDPMLSTPIGYTSYACIGQYNLTGTIATTTTVAPAFTTQPTSQAVISGNSVTFTAAASGTPTPTYQWYYNGAAISGATSTSYTIATTSSANGGNYYMVATNSAGSATSSTAILTVNFAPTIATQPISATIASGVTATLTVVASGTPTPTYQWYQGTSGVTTTPISGATSSSYTTPALTATTSYWVRVTNAVGTASSSTATVTVDLSYVVPAITTQPASTAITSGSTATLSVIASGTPTPTYQWYQGASGITTTPISGATASSYTTPILTTTTSYWVRVTNAAGNASSLTAIVTVNPVNVAPAITSQPASPTIGPGGTATLTVVASGTPTPTYQWYQGASGVTTTPIGGATSSSYTTPALSATTSYWVSATNTLGTASSSTATVTVNTSYVAPAITTQPASPTIAYGGTATLSVVASGTPTPTYQWYRGTSGITTTPISGGIASSYTTPALTTTTLYWVQATNAAGTASSLTATVTVSNPPAPVITSAPFAGAAIGEPFSYTISATNSPQTFAAVPLPGGLFLNSNTGVISGTPTTAGTTSLTINATNAGGTGTAALSLLVLPATTITTFAGSLGLSGATNSTTATSATFKGPADIAADAAGVIYVADTGNHLIRKIALSGAVTTFAGSGTAGSLDGTGAAAQFNGPAGVAVDGTGNVCVADTVNHTIRKITAAGVVTTLAGTAGSAGSIDATGAAARFNQPADLVVDSAGNIYVADTGNHTLRKITAAGAVTTLAGTAGLIGTADGTGGAARFNAPRSLALDPLGNLYVADTGSLTIRKVTSAGVVTTLAGTAGLAGTADGIGPAAKFNAPSGLALDLNGFLYVSDRLNHTLRRVTPSNNLVITLAGSAGTAGAADGSAATVRLNSPSGLAVDLNGYLFIADINNHSIRVTSSAPSITTQPQSQTVTAGTSVNFTVVVAGQPVPALQWYKDNVAISGATAATLTITNAQSANAGSYKVTATNLLGSVTSGSATLTVNASSSSSSSGSSSSSSSSGSPSPSSGSSSSSGGGGGASSEGFLITLGALAVIRKFTTRRR